MSLVTQRKSLNSAVRLGAGDCAVLNVNAGSFANPAHVVIGNDPTHDMCMFSGELHAIHVEGDKTVGTGLGQTRGPYVQKYSGGAWSLVGTTLCPDADSGSGTRMNPGRCRIATDSTGTYLFASFTDQNRASGVYTVRIYQWGGASWAQVSSEVCAFGSIPSLAVSPSGLAYVAYQLDTYRPVRIFRSDGTGLDVPGTLPDGYRRGDQNATPALAVQSDGRVVGAYTPTSAIVGRSFSLLTEQQWLVLFDADTGAELRRTAVTLPPSDFMPYIVLPRTVESPFLELTQNAVGGYDGDKILFGEAWSGGAIVPEDGAGDFTTLSGGYGFGGPSRFCLDPADPADRRAWFTGLPPGFFDIGIDVWDAACSSQFVPANPINHEPQHTVYLEEGLASGTCLQIGPGLRGPCIPVCDGTYLYVLWLYFPFNTGSDAIINNDLQWIVYRFTITTTECGGATAPVFASRHKAV